MYVFMTFDPMGMQGMEKIETLDPRAFSSYLHETQNTICGRHPIAVLLNVSWVSHDWSYGYHVTVQAVSELQSTRSEVTCEMKFVCYAQSNKCRSPSDSSVSYASASLTLSTD